MGFGVLSFVDCSEEALDQIQIPPGLGEALRSSGRNLGGSLAMNLGPSERPAEGLDPRPEDPAKRRARDERASGGVADHRQIAAGEVDALAGTDVEAALAGQTKLEQHDPLEGGVVTEAEIGGVHGLYLEDCADGLA